MKALRIVLLVQSGILLLAWVAFVAQPLGLGTLYLLAYIVALGVAVAAFAVWQSRRTPEARPLAVYSLIATALTVATPFVIDALNLPPMPPQTVAAAALVLMLLVIAGLLIRRKRWQPGAMFTGRAFNKTVLISVMIAVALIWAPLVVWLAAGNGAELGTSPARDNATRTAFFVYYLSLSVPASVLVAFTLLFSLAGLVRHAGARLIHTGQLACSLVLIASLGVVAGGLGLALVNPG